MREILFRRNLSRIVALASLSASLHLALGQTATPNAMGLSLGQTAPGFKLKDQAGTEHALSELLKKGPVALVFYRSADW